MFRYTCSPLVGRKATVGGATRPSSGIRSAALGGCGQSMLLSPRWIEDNTEKFNPLHRGLTLEEIRAGREAIPVTFDRSKMMKIITWNVASLRSLLAKDPRGKKVGNGKKEFDQNPLALLMQMEQPDVLCLQETKLSPDHESTHHLIAPFEGYTFKDSISRHRKGYSGTRTYIREPPMSETPVRSGTPTSPETQATSVRKNISWWLGLDYSKPQEEHLLGRVLTSRWENLPVAGGGGNSRTSNRSGYPELNTVTVTNTYVVNAGDQLQRLDHKCNDFNPSLGSFLNSHQYQAPASGKGKKKVAAGAAGTSTNANSLVVWTGDINCAPLPYDRYWDPIGGSETMQQEAGFTPQEKESFQKLLQQTDMVDTFRYLYPHSREVFTYWNYYANERLRNRGWRIDGFMVPRKDLWRVVDVMPLKKVMGSDHCPVAMWLWK